MFTKSGVKPMNSHNYVFINFGDYIYSSSPDTDAGFWNCFSPNEIAIIAGSRKSPLSVTQSSNLNSWSLPFGYISVLGGSHFFMRTRRSKKIHFIFLIGSTMICTYIYIHQWRCFYLETFWMEWNPKPNLRIVSYGEVVFFFLTPPWLDPSYWFFFFLPTPYLPPPSCFPFPAHYFSSSISCFLSLFICIVCFFPRDFFLSFFVCVCEERRALEQQEFVRSHSASNVCGM